MSDELERSLANDPGLRRCLHPQTLDDIACCYGACPPAGDPPSATKARRPNEREGVKKMASRRASWPPTEPAKRLESDSDVSRPTATRSVETTNGASGLACTALKIARTVRVRACAKQAENGRVRPTRKRVLSRETELGRTRPKSTRWTLNPKVEGSSSSRLIGNGGQRQRRRAVLTGSERGRLERT